MTLGVAGTRLPPRYLRATQAQAIGHPLRALSIPASLEVLVGHPLLSSVAKLTSMTHRQHVLMEVTPKPIPRKRYAPQNPFPDRQAVAPPGACLRPQSRLNMETIKIGKPFPETVFRANLGGL